jgi:hypothetical protein
MTTQNPGPWYASPTKSFMVFADDDTFVCNVSNVHNAKLIAAAPDLLDACRAIVEMQKHCMYDRLNPCSLGGEIGKHWGGVFSQSCAFCHAKMAIDKATK